MNMINKYIKQGVIIQIPRKVEDKKELFRYVSELFSYDVIYTEEEVNEILKKIYVDYAILRRYLIDFKFLERNNTCTIYKKI